MTPRPDDTTGAGPRDATEGRAGASRAEPIGIDGVSKRYGDLDALSEVSLDIAGGEFLTLLGPSGSGKTTLLMVLAGFVRPSAGRIRVGGADLTRTPPHKRDFGMVFQNYALFPHMSVAENVGYPLRVRRHDKARIAREVADTLDLVQLGHLADRGAEALSGGQRQRVALARAIVFRPRVLLMDEPLSALDKKLRDQMQIEIRHLHERLGITTVYVTHDQREALTMSDRIAVIHDGRLAQVATPVELYQRPADAFVADFIGESTMLPVTRDGGGWRFGDTALQIASSPEEGPGDRFLVVRPEKLDLVGAGEGASPDHNRFAGTLEEVIFQGDTFTARIALAGGRMMTLRRSTRRDVQERLGGPGNPVTLALHRDDSVIVAGHGR